MAPGTRQVCTLNDFQMYYYVNMLMM